MSRKTIHVIQAKTGKEKITCLTAYTAPIARLLDKHIDILLVGDSLCLLYTSPSPRDRTRSRMPSSA